MGDDFKKLFIFDDDDDYRTTNRNIYLPIIENRERVYWDLEEEQKKIKNKNRDEFNFKRV